MQVVGVVGADETNVQALADDLVPALAERGDVATVRQDEGAPSAVDERATETHRLGSDGQEAVVRADRDLDAILEDLAPRADYAVLVGFPEADVPTVALGDADHGGETLVAADGPSAVDVDEVVAAVEEAEPLETLASLVATVEEAPGEAFSGAIATFTGRVRAREDESDVRTEFLEFEKYDGVAESKMDGIRRDIEARDGVYAVEVAHKTGVVPAGEHVVHVVVLAGHRAQAFSAVQDGINRLKAEVPLFKKEVTVDDEFWAHQRE